MPYQNNNDQFELSPDYAGGAGGPFDSPGSNNSSSDNSGGWYSDLFGNLGDILKGSANVISAVKGNPSTTNVVNQGGAGAAGGTNTIIYAVVGIMVVLVIIIIALRR